MNEKAIQTFKEMAATHGLPLLVVCTIVGFFVWDTHQDKETHRRVLVNLSKEQVELFKAIELNKRKSNALEQRRIQIVEEFNALQAAQVEALKVSNANEARLAAAIEAVAQRGCP